MNAGKLRQFTKDDDDEDARENLGGFIASKPLLLSAATFLGAGGLWFAEPDKGSLLTALKPYAPAAMSLAGSFLAGLIIGRIARRRLSKVLIAGGLGVSALGLQRVLGFGSQQTAWTMLHKFRKAMVRPSRTKLVGEVEVDETYVGGPSKGGKRGRGAGKKFIVVIAVELHDPKGFGRSGCATCPMSRQPASFPLLAMLSKLTRLSALTGSMPTTPYRRMDIGTISSFCRPATVQPMWISHHR